MGIFSELLVVAVLVAMVRSHGMLIEPPNRGSMWRYGFNTPPNYSDNQQYCGGRQVQWEQHNGKCGECGDNYGLPRPRPAENGGTYGLGIITRTYKKGQTITVNVLITANHYGNFDFRLCPLSTSGDLETQECFMQHPLQLASGGYRFPLTTSMTGTYPVTLQLPADVTCQHCVLQWMYETGNSWGVCANGTGALGCGPQEHFVTCSDIAIV